MASPYVLCSARIRRDAKNPNSYEPCTRRATRIVDGNPVCGLHARPKTLAEKIADADARGNHWLAEANAAKEAGDNEKANKLYDKGQFWLDKSNRLRGCL